MGLSNPWWIHILWKSSLILTLDEYIVSLIGLWSARFCFSLVFCYILPIENRWEIVYGGFPFSSKLIRVNVFSWGINITYANAFVIVFDWHDEWICNDACWIILLTRRENFLKYQLRMNKVDLIVQSVWSICLEFNEMCILENKILFFTGKKMNSLIKKCMFPRRIVYNKKIWYW